MKVRSPSTRSVGVAPADGEALSEELPAWLEALAPQVVVATYWLDPGVKGKSFSARVRFTGRRCGVVGRLQPEDRFDRTETVLGIVPGSGPVAITTTAIVPAPGDWLVSAEPSTGGGDRRLRPARRVSPLPDGRPTHRASAVQALRFWGTPSMAAPLPGTIAARRKSLVAPPGSLIGSWPVLVLIGVILGLLVQWQLILRSGLRPWSVAGLTIAAAVAGYLGAKAWFLVLERRITAATLTEGLCIQGFIVGAALVLLAGVLVLHLPPGTVADDTAPALFFGIAVGRLGCFLTGCCAGRPTASRWGIWSSDRRIGARRVPTQLWEAFLGLALGLVTLLMVLRGAATIPGAIALGSLAVYTLGRQALFGYRNESRRSTLARPLVIAVAGLLLAGDVVSSMLARA